MDESIQAKADSCLLLTEDYIVLEAETSLLELLGYDLEGLRGCHFESILTRSSSIFLHLHFTTRMKLDGKIEHMHLFLRGADGGGVPMIMDAFSREREGKLVYECWLRPSGEALSGQE